MVVLAFISRNLEFILTAIGLISAGAFSLYEIFKKKEQKKRLAGFVLSSVLLLSFLLIAKLYYDDRFTDIPNIVGLDYTSAMQVLREAHLEPQVLLAEANDFLSPTCRVYWQSEVPGGTVTRGETLYFAFDDYYSVGSTAAISSILARTKTYYVYVQTPQNKIFIEKDRLFYNSNEQTSHYTLVGSLETFDTSRPELGEQEIIAEAMYCAADNLLEKAGEDTYATIDKVEIIGTGRVPTNIAFHFGKLQPITTFPASSIVHKKNAGEDWIVTLPRDIPTGDYTYYFSLVDNEGKCYGGSFPVVVDLGF